MVQYLGMVKISSYLKQEKDSLDKWVLHGFCLVRKTGFW